MKFGTYHTFQVPPWTTTEQVYAEEFARVDLAEALGYDSVWVPEQHFFDYCACPDALDMAVHLLGHTSRVRVGAGFKLDYFEVRHAETLAPIGSVKDGPVRILVAAKLGKTRLIDNVGV